MARKEYFRLNFLMPAELWARLEKISKELQMPKAGIVRVALENYLAFLEKAKRERDAEVPTVSLADLER